MDPGQRADEDLPSWSDFQAIGPALHILQVSATMRKLLSVIAAKNNVDIICLQETHVDVDVSSRFIILGFDLLHMSTKTTMHSGKRSSTRLKKLQVNRVFHCTLGLIFTEYVNSLYSFETKKIKWGVYVLLSVIFQ